MTSRILDMHLEIVGSQYAGKTPAVRSLADAADFCRRYSVDAKLFDEDEQIGTVGPTGVIRDLDQKIVELDVTA